MIVITGEDNLIATNARKTNKWEKFKLWLWHRKRYKSISIWVRKEGEE